MDAAIGFKYTQKNSVMVVEKLVILMKDQFCALKLGDDLRGLTT